MTCQATKLLTVKRLFYYYYYCVPPQCLKSREETPTQTAFEIYFEKKRVREREETENKPRFPMKMNTMMELFFYTAAVKQHNALDSH